jgi:hypothetical protein
MRTLLTACLALMLTSTAHTQDAETLDEVTVTGSRISYEDLLETPAVGVVRRADAIMLSFRLTNDSRDVGQREAEIRATLRALMRAAGPRFAFENEEGKLADAESPMQFESGSKPDTSYVRIALRASMEGNSTQPKQLVQDMRSLLKNAAAQGRTEIFLESETALSIARPERFRPLVLKAIAEDTAQIRSVFGAGCVVTLSNLGNRVEWERVGTGELFLFVRYGIELSNCSDASK